MKAFQLIRVASAAAAMVAFGSGAFAQSTANVTVKVSLTSSCAWSTAGTAPTPTLDFLTYTAFQTADNTASTTFDVQCTHKIAAAPTASWDATSGVVGGLAYTLDAPSAAKKSGGTDATATAAATADMYTFTLGGTLPGGQPGETGAAASQTRVLTMSF